MLDAPYPELDDLLEMIGEAGQRLSDIDASEGAAGGGFVGQGNGGGNVCGDIGRCV